MFRSLLLLVCSLIIQFTTSDEICDDMVFAGSHQHFHFRFTFVCESEIIQLNFTNSKYRGWFGIVFNDAMSGSAVVFTTGKSNARNISLYSYTISWKTYNGVSYSSSDDWNELETYIDGSTARFIYWQHLNKTHWDLDTETITLRMASHDSSYQLSMHNYASDAVAVTINGVVVAADDNTLKLLHGAFMWFAWSVCASFGVLFSAHRNLHDLTTIWFKVHRAAQLTTMVLSLIGVLIAIVSIVVNNDSHLDESHKTQGSFCVLYAIIVAITGARTACYGRENTVKGTINQRIVGLCHGANGYFIWGACQFLTFSGLMLIYDVTHFAFYIQGLWLLLVVAVCFMLWAYRCAASQDDDEDELAHISEANENVNENEIDLGVNDVEGREGGRNQGEIIYDVV